MFRCRAPTSRRRRHGWSQKLLVAAGLLVGGMLLAPSLSLEGSSVRQLEECEELVDDNAPIYADAVVAVVISLILLTIVFEKLHDTLQEKARATMHGLEGVVDALMGELTVLGFIGLVSFAVVKLGFAKHLSKRIFTSETESSKEWEEHSRCAEGELGEIIEDMHMTIFGIMVGYIVEVIYVIGVANNNSDLWNEAERAIDDKAKYHEAYAALQQEQRNPTVWCKWTHWGQGSCCCGRGGGEAGLFTVPSRAHRIVCFDRLKARFIQQANKHHGRLHGSSLGSGFLLSHYLSVRQHAVLESLVELPVSQWLFMIALALALRVGLVLNDWLRLWAFIGFGWLVLLITLAVRLKVARIVKMVTPRAPRLCDTETPRPWRSVSTDSKTSMSLSRDESLEIFLASDTSDSGNELSTAEGMRPHRAISSLPVQVQHRASTSAALPASSATVLGKFSDLSSAQRSDNRQRLLPPLFESDAEFQAPASGSALGITATLHGHKGLLRTPKLSSSKPHLSQDSNSATSGDTPVRSQLNTSVQIQDSGEVAAVQANRRGRRRLRSHTHQTNRLTRHESFHELLPAYRQEGKVVDELFWLHGCRGHFCLRCRSHGGEGHVESHVPEHVEIKKWVLSLMLLLNTVYVTVLFKEGVSTIIHYYSTGQEEHSHSGTGSADGEDYIFHQANSIRNHSRGTDTEQHNGEEEARELLDWLGLMVTLTAAFFPPIFFLFFVVPNALLDYITATSVEKFIHQSAINRVVREQKEATLRHVFKMLAMVRRQALLFSHLLEDEETEQKHTAVIKELTESHGVEHSPISSNKDDHLTFRSAELEPEQLAEIKIMFKRYDQDNSGVVDFQEFSGLVSELGGGGGSNSHDWHEAELHELFSRLDTDGGGTVDFNEFARFTARHFQPLSVEEECDLIIALIQGGGSGDDTAPVSTMDLRGFLRGYARGFGLDDPSRRRIMLSSDSITQTLDQQTERWADCKVPGARLYTVTRDVEASDGTQMTRGDLIVITERMPNVRKDAQLSDGDINMVIRAVDPAGEGVVSVSALKELLQRDAAVHGGE